MNYVRLGDENPIEKKKHGCGAKYSLRTDMFVQNQSRVHFFDRLSSAKTMDNLRRSATELRSVFVKLKRN